jgi:diaminohydroxyphosphoribosylaminopyrimidine deaminase/5-amino-6-(5-phosphoribosylamino)uracil reductase
MTDAECMRRCLELAERGRCVVGNGAMVGAVLVRSGKVIAEGFHKGFGKPHAERQLLEKFEQKIDSTDTLYVNLEPCVAHKTKKNPPCSDIILEKGIKRVVYGMLDPDPRVAGKGIAQLRKAGIQVLGPVLPGECLRLNRGFVSARTKHRPWITLKRAQARDGSIANPDGSFLKITNKAQDTWSHTFLRAKHDAILIGVGTALADNPHLTIRHCQAGYQPWRIILDSGLRMPMTAHLVQDTFAARTIVITRPRLGRIPSSVIPILQARGVRVLQVKHGKDGVDLPSLWNVLLTPNGDYHGLTSILVEGGVKTWATFTKAGCVDEEVTLMGDN